MRTEGTKEWASKNWNIYLGCENGCRYCYAMLRQMRYRRVQTPAEWRLMCPTKPKHIRRFPGTVMFSSTHDLVASNADRSLAVLRDLLAAGNQVLVVTKPRLEIIRRIVTELAEYRDQIYFRFTITALDPTISAWWEPNAPHPAERIESLALAAGEGYRVSVSCEPYLEDPRDIFDAISGFPIEEFWVGIMNYLSQVNSVMLRDTPDDGEIIAREVNRISAISSDDYARNLLCEMLDPRIRWKDTFRKPIEENLRIKQMIGFLYRMIGFLERAAGTACLESLNLHGLVYLAQIENPAIGLTFRLSRGHAFAPLLNELWTHTLSIIQSHPPFLRKALESQFEYVALPRLLQNIQNTFGRECLINDIEILASLHLILSHNLGPPEEVMKKRCRRLFPAFSLLATEYLDLITPFLEIPTR